MNICEGKSCKFVEHIPGDCHIRCLNPPKCRDEINSGGNERYDKASEIVNTNQSVVRCIWPGSGWFPFAFDSNTIFGCCNYERNQNSI